MPPPGACSEWIVYRLNSNSSSATRPFLDPTLLPTLRQGFTAALFRIRRDCAAEYNLLGDEEKRLSLGTKEYFCREYSLTTSEAPVTVF
jgi:hypothetical protein